MMKAAEHRGGNDASVGVRCCRSVWHALPDSLMRLNANLAGYVVI
jgi:hypothetical protein